MSTCWSATTARERPTSSSPWATSASARASSGRPDATVLQRGAPFFTIEGTFRGEDRPDVALRLAFVPGEGKRAFANGAPLERLTALVGRVPVVILSPDDRDLTAGGPVERRRLLDATLSQAYPVYLDDLLKYRRALKQKNALLQQLRRGRSLAPGTVDAWDEELATLGGRVVERRRAFLERFAVLIGRGPPSAGRAWGGAHVAVRAVERLRPRVGHGWTPPSSGPYPPPQLRTRQDARRPSPRRGRVSDRRVRPAALRLARPAPDVRPRGPGRAVSLSSASGRTSPRCCSSMTCSDLSIPPGRASSWSFSPPAS